MAGHGGHERRGPRGAAVTLNCCRHSAADHNPWQRKKRANWCSRRH
jgi:hypothetical protein